MIENLTRFGAAAAFGYDIDGSQLVVLCVAGRFLMPAGGINQEEALRPSDDQPPPPMADQHFGDPATSSLRCPGQGAVRRDRAEIYVAGTAWAPMGRKVKEICTSVKVGRCTKDVWVVGDRFWSRGVSRLVASAPQPFVSLPLVYERSFGGTAYADDGGLLAQEAYNPIGRGVYSSREDAIGQPLPNLEKPGERLTSWDGQITTWGYGAIPGSWQPRLGLAGTYDERWAQERLPLWPCDVDPRYFCAASEGLSVAGPLRGGEPVLLQGFSPDGQFRFNLPEIRIMAKAYYVNSSVRCLMRLEGVLIEPDELVLTLFWRQTMPLGRGASGFQRAIVRSLEPWEGTMQ